MKALTLVISAAALLAASPVVAQEKSWSGPYIGAIGTYTWTGIDYPGAPEHPDGPPRPSLEGGLLGIQAGYGLQFGQVYAGVEGDWSFGNITTTVRDGNSITESASIDQLGTLRGRVGLIVGDFMPYITAGVAFEKVGIGQQCPDPASQPYGWCSTPKGNAPYNLTSTEWNVGYVVGGGLEWRASDHLSLKIEGLYTAYGDETYELGKVASGKDLAPIKIDHDETLIRLGAAYRF